MVWQSAKKVHIPIIGMGGIETGEDAAAFMLCGAKAVMVGHGELHRSVRLPAHRSGAGRILRPAEGAARAGTGRDAAEY